MGQGLEIDDRVVEEMLRYEDGDARLDLEYARRLATAVRGLILSTALQRLEALAAGTCSSFVDVVFEAPGFAPGVSAESDVAREFEAGFVRIEVVACVPDGDADPEAALREYTDPAFRRAVSSRVKRIWNDGGESCVETTGFAAFLKSTLSCNRIEELLMPTVAAQHAQVVRNPAADEHQVVFFKESLKTFVRLPSGLALHYINYTRTDKFGGLRKRVGRGKIIGSQERAVEHLRAWLDGGPRDD